MHNHGTRKKEETERLCSSLNNQFLAATPTQVPEKAIPKLRKKEIGKEVGFSVN